MLRQKLTVYYVQKSDSISEPVLLICVHRIRVLMVRLILYSAVVCCYNHRYYGQV